MKNLNPCLDYVTKNSRQKIPNINVCVSFCVLLYHVWLEDRIKLITNNSLGYILQL